MNSIQIKIQKSSKTMAIILKILCILLVIGIGIPIVTLIWVTLEPNVNITSIRGLNFYSSAGTILESKGEVIAEMCTIIVSGILMFFMLATSYCMFKSINTDIAPFSKPNVQRLKNLGILLLVYALVVPIARTGFYSTFAPTINIHSSFNISFAVLALSFFFIAKVFEYGAELQRQSDETL